MSTENKTPEEISADEIRKFASRLQYVAQSSGLLAGAEQLGRKAAGLSYNLDKTAGFWNDMGQNIRGNVQDAWGVAKSTGSALGQGFTTNVNAARDVAGGLGSIARGAGQGFMTNVNAVKNAPGAIAGAVGEFARGAMGQGSPTSGGTGGAGPRRAPAAPAAPAGVPAAAQTPAANPGVAGGGGRGPQGRAPANPGVAGGGGFGPQGSAPAAGAAPAAPTPHRPRHHAAPAAPAPAGAPAAAMAPAAPETQQAAFGTSGPSWANQPAPNMTMADTGKPGYGGPPPASGPATSAGGGLEGAMAGFKAQAPNPSWGSSAPAAPQTPASGVQKAPYSYSADKQQGFGFSRA